MRRSSLAILGLVLCLGCKNKGGQSGSREVLAQIDDDVISVADLEQQINSQPPHARLRYLSNDRKKELLEQTVRFEVMAKEAQKKGYDQDPELRRALKQQLVGLLIRRDFDARFKPEDIPEADAIRYFKEHPDEFAREDQVRVSQVLVKDPAQAQKVQTLLKTLLPGDERGFQDIVARNSIDEDSKVRGGDLTFFDRNSTRYPKPIVDAAFALQNIGEISPPIKSDRGYHVLRLTQKRPGFKREFHEVRQDIQKRLYQERRAKKLEEWTAELQGRMKVKMFEEKLKDVRVENGAVNAAATATGNRSH